MKDPSHEPARDADGCVGQDPADTEVTTPSGGRSERGELPLRQTVNLPLRRRIRRMDDPEVLERVLAGLLGLP